MRKTCSAELVDRFVYGGVDQRNWTNVFDDIHILSIPGFVWFKAPVNSTPRVSHTCEIIGRRQLLVIGGLDNADELGKNYWHDFTVPDPLKQGIGVFDMTDMSWKLGYDADADDYQSPQIVKDWYSAG